MAFDPKVIAATIGGVAALGSAGVGVTGANVSSKKQYKYQSKLQAQAAKLNYDYSLLSAKNTPSATREGLENAGYNPMLAVQNSTSGANSSWTSAGNSTAPDYVSAISQGVANAQSFQRLKNETKTADTQAKMNEATAENQSSQAMNNLEENKWISPKRKSEIANIQGDTMLKEAQIDNMKKQIELGFAGLSTTRRGQDLVYNASTLTPSKYLIDKGESIYSSFGRPKTPKELGEGIYKYYYNRRKR